MFWFQMVIRVFFNKLCVANVHDEGNNFLIFDFICKWLLGTQYPLQQIITNLENEILSNYYYYFVNSSYELFLKFKLMHFRKKRRFISFLNNVFDVEFYEHVQLLVWVKFSQKSKLKLKF
jgi:hypothetical protein